MKHKKIILELAKIKTPCYACNESERCFQFESGKEIDCPELIEYLSTVLETLAVLISRKGKEKTFPEDSVEYRLALYLKKWILKNNPKARLPEDLQVWCKGFDEIVRIDKRDPDEIKNVISWAQQHHFWFKNILSPKKLRIQYDRLLLDMNGRAKQRDDRFDNLK